LQPDPQADALALKPSTALAQVPPERPAAPPSAAPGAMTAQARGTPDAHTGPAPAPQPAAATWLLGAGLLVATGAWLFERRRRRLLMTEKDSVMWADVQPPGRSIITTAGGLDAILPDSPNAAEKAREIYVAQISETNSRREATLIDLHQLDAKLRRRREKGDHVAALLLLQQHLVDFRYTSPWVFLELREQYLQLGRQKEWDTAREAFRQRFGQNAPAWSAPSTGHVEFVHDLQLCKEITRCWPYREARIFILRWMLGDPESRQRAMGPPLLALGVYRDMMLLDHILDEVMVVRPRQADSLL
jgi:hypothetical protein